MTNRAKAIERDIVHELIITMKHHRSAIDRAHETNAVGRTAHRMLMHIACKDGNCSQKELAEHLEISTAAVATTLKKLESDGYIHRSANPDDSRFNRIELTDCGERLVNSTKAFFEEVDSALFVGFTEEERRKLLDFVGRMAQNMRDYDRKENG